MKNNEIIEKVLKPNISKIYPEMIAKDLASVQPINVSLKDWFKKSTIVIPEFYQKIIDEIKSIKTIHTIYYDERNDMIYGNISLENYKTATTEFNSIEEQYFKEYEQDILAIKSICKKFNVNVEFKIGLIHDIFKGCFNIIDITIKEKDLENE